MAASTTEPRTVRVYSTRVWLPAFTPEIHSAFRRARIDCYRVPAYSRNRVDARLELEARHPFEALARIYAALRSADWGGFHPGRDAIFWPVERGGVLSGDGPPE